MKTLSACLYHSLEYYDVWKIIDHRSIVVFIFYGFCIFFSKYILQFWEN